MQSIVVNNYTLTCAVGTGMADIRAAIAAKQSGLTNTPWPDCGLDTWLGRVTELDTNPIDLDPNWQSRNNRLAKLGTLQDDFGAAVNQALEQFGPARCGVVLGTSTSSIGRTEEGYRQLDQEGRFPAAFRQSHIHNPNAPTAFISRELGTHGPNLTISTACSSSAKAFATAARWLQQDLVDAVIVGGVDSLCQSVIYGFNSLQLIDPEPCKPFDVERGGISLGEAAGYALLTREPMNDSGIRLTGYGESSDAYHMSSAHPDGLGAELAIRAALERSNQRATDIEYINLHGTGTRANDEIESKVCKRIFPASTLCSSTKGWTGHTLGAAGICEAVLTIDALATGLLPGCINTNAPEPQIKDQLLMANLNKEINSAMSNSFGFGGNNCSLIFARA
jgi:3-oxoacyl-[acyl-carrier-protein] synthase-1